MKIKPSFKLGSLSKSNYRHFPLLYFAYGRDGFAFTIFGLTLTVKL